MRRSSSVLMRHCPLTRQANICPPEKQLCCFSGYFGSIMKDRKNDEKLPLLVCYHVGEREGKP